MDERDLFRRELRNKIDHLNKPKGSLGRLEDLAFQIACVQNSLKPELKRPCHLLFAGDHGIEKEHVSPSPREVTWQQMINFTRGGGAVNMFCRQHNFSLYLVDVGIDHDLSSYPLILNRKVALGTSDFLLGPAMTPDQMNSAWKVGVDMVNQCYQAGCNVVSIGEMGISNTSSSSIWMHLMTDIDLAKCVGPGSGLDPDGVKHKFSVLRKAVKNYRKDNDIPDTAERVVQWFGGFEMVAAVGAMLQATNRDMIVLVDGFIMTACALVASKMNSEVLAHAIFCHKSDERGHALLLDYLGVQPLLNLGLRVGEGTGALCAYPLIESAVHMLNEMSSFDESHVTKYF